MADVIEHRHDTRNPDRVHGFLAGRYFGHVPHLLVATSLTVGDAPPLGTTARCREDTAPSVLRGFPYVVVGVVGEEGGECMRWWGLRPRGAHEPEPSDRWGR